MSVAVIVCAVIGVGAVFLLLSLGRIGRRPQGAHTAVARIRSEPLDGSLEEGAGSHRHGSH